MTINDAFIRELLEASSDMERITKPERARLLERAAATIADLREHAQYPPAAANDDGGSVKEMREMARLIALFSAEEVSVTIRNAAALIAAAQMIVERKVH